MQELRKLRQYAFYRDLQKQTAKLRYKNGGCRKELKKPSNFTDAVISDYLEKPVARVKGPTKSGHPPEHHHTALVYYTHLSIIICS